MTTSSGNNVVVGKGELRRKCRRCPSREYVDVSIHEGRGIRRDCACCGVFLAFIKWEPSDKPDVK